MARLRLATRLSLVMAGLSVVMTLVTILALGTAIYWQTEGQMREQLVTEANKLVTDYLVLQDNTVALASNTDVEGLATTLRLYGLNMQLTDRNLQTIAQYGVYRDMSSTELAQIMTPVATSRYEDKHIPQFGTYDLYTVALKAKGETYGYLQVARLNTVLPMLLTMGVTMVGVMLPIVVLISFLFAYWSTRQALSPLSKLVEYVEKLDPDKLEQEIAVPETLDPETTMLTRSLNMMTARVKKVMARQREVAENISHEFKTPLTRVASGLQLLSGKVERAEQRTIRQIEREIVDLGKSVDAILAVATEPKAVKGKTTISVESLINETLVLVPKNLKVNSWIKPGLQIDIPATQMKVILRNLIENAVKYNREDGYIHVRASEGGDEWFVEVVNSVGTHMAKGHGLGLVIVKRICERQGWRLLTDKADPKVAVIKVSGKR